MPPIAGLFADVGLVRRTNPQTTDLLAPLTPKASTSKNHRTPTPTSVWLLPGLRVEGHGLARRPE
ncbi:hypothetical protein ACFFR3_20165 [Nonomuraea salmonea]|uniref:Uncharacterized protein n=1 Tax=Nonomuraea salmonea TaxID=46181 RepID=A0ABV5NNN5_9ACTN